MSLDGKWAEQTNNQNQFICFIIFINVNYQTSEKEKSLILESGQTRKKEKTTKLKTTWMVILTEIGRIENFGSCLLWLLKDEHNREDHNQGNGANYDVLLVPLTLGLHAWPAHNNAHAQSTMVDNQWQ